MAEKEDKKPEEKTGEGKPGEKIGELEKEEIVLEAKNEAAIEIASLTVPQFKKIFGKLYARIVTEVTGVTDAASLKVPGFLLEADDPFAEGAARVFGREKGIATVRLPIVLPFKDPASKAALESYILRAEGGGDKKRSKMAKAALKKIKV